jgi:hypothetical protein
MVFLSISGPRLEAFTLSLSPRSMYAVLSKKLASSLRLLKKARDDLVGPKVALE